MENGAIILALISGLLGTFVGGWLSYRGALDATSKSIKALHTQEEERREFERDQQIHRVIVALLTECRLNLELATKWATSDSKVPISTDAWIVYKGQIDFFTLERQMSLLKVYSEIARYNGLVEYDRQVVPYGAGYMNSSIEKQAIIIKRSLDEIIPHLEELLS